VIIPLLNGLLSFSKAPVTWILVFLNVFVMAMTSFSSGRETKILEGLFQDKAFMEIQALVYRSYLEARPKELVKRELASLVRRETKQSDRDLATLAFRDQDFLESQESDFSFPDEVAYSYWKSHIDQFLTVQLTSVNHLWGISATNSSWTSWLSYMFVHAGWMHLGVNMIFLVLAGGSLELSVGSLGVLIVYLFSGFIAGGSYILLSGLSASPLVGASGAVSGLITFFAVLNWNRPVRFVYWLLVPQKNAFGFIYLPGLFLFYLWGVADLTGYLSSSEFSSGVAYAAHMGGHLTGILAGVTLLFLARWSGRPPAGEPSRKMYELEPLVLVHRL